MSDASRFTLYINDKTNEEWVVPDANTVKMDDEESERHIDQFNDEVIERIQDVYTVVDIHVSADVEGDDDDIIAMWAPDGFRVLAHSTSNGFTLYGVMASLKGGSDAVELA